MKPMRPLGIFCVEGDWSPLLTERASVRELLQLLENVAGIPFIHHHIDSPEGLFDLLGQWSQRRYARYSLGYFAFHGQPGHLQVGRSLVSLEELAHALEGALTGKIAYFGSCSVLKVPPEELDAFCSLTGSPCVVGFTRDVDWVASAALDLLLLQAIAVRKDPDEARRWIEEEFGGLGVHLGLRVY